MKMTFGLLGSLFSLKSALLGKTTTSGGSSSSSQQFDPNFDPNSVTGLVGLWDFKSGATTTDTGRDDNNINQFGTFESGASASGDRAHFNGSDDRFDVEGDNGGVKEQVFDLASGVIEVQFTQDHHIGSSHDTLVNRGEYADRSSEGWFGMQVSHSGEVKVIHISNGAHSTLKTSAGFFDEGDTVNVKYAWSESEGAVLIVNNLTTGQTETLETSTTGLTMDIGDNDDEIFTFGAREGNDGSFDQEFDGSIDYVAVYDAPQPQPNDIVDGENTGELMGPGYDDALGATNSGGDIIDGADGLDDTILGNGGNDTINAGLGDDEVYGGSGDDSILGGDGADTITGDSGSVTDVVVDSGTVSGDDTIDGGAGDDLIYGDNGVPVEPVPGNPTTLDISDLSGGRIVSEDGAVTTDVSLGGFIQTTSSSTFGKVTPDNVFYSGPEVGGSRNTLDLDFDTPVSDVSFTIFDVNSGSGWDDQVRIIALDADGNQLPVTFSGTNVNTGGVDVRGNTIDGNDNNTTFRLDANNPDNVQVQIEGPISSLQVIHEPGNDTSNVIGFIGVGDIDVTPILDAGGPGGTPSSDDGGDDVIDGGIGEDTIFGEGGDDTIDGGADDDLIYGDNGSTDPAGSVVGSSSLMDIDNLSGGTLTSNDGSVTAQVSLDDFTVQPAGFLGATSDVFYAERISGSNQATLSFDFQDDVQVQDVSFTLFDVNDGNNASFGNWDDQVTIIALDENGQQVPVTFSGGNINVNGNTIESDSVSGSASLNGSNADNVQVSIQGPISSLQIIYEDGPDNSVTGYIGVSDLTVTSVTPDDGVGTGSGDSEGGDDVIDGGIGEDTIFGEGGDDTIDGGADDDLIYGDSNEDLSGTGSFTGPRESFNWDLVSSTQADSSVVQDTGDVNVTYSRITDTGSHESDIDNSTNLNTDGIDSGSETIDTNSSLSSITNGNGNEGAFQWEFDEPVGNVEFNVNDLDADGVVTITAYGPDGVTEIPVQLVGGSDIVVNGNVATAIGPYQNDNDPDVNVQVTIPGPVSRIVLEHEQIGSDNSGIHITDMYFDTGFEPGNDGQNGEGGDDVITGGEGSDTMFGEGGDDTFLVGSASEGAGDVIDGGNGPDESTDFDVLDLRGAGPVTIDEQVDDNDEGATEGTVTFEDGSTLTFEGIEQILTDPNQTAPEAVDDGFTVSEDQDPADVVGNVLANDDDAETPNDLVVSDVDGSAPGTPVAGDNGGLITIEEDGSVSFDPNDAFDDLAPGETATTTVEYTVVDPSGLEDTATVTFTVTGVNDDPDAVDDSDTTAFETPVTIDLLANDTDVDNAPGDLVVSDATVDPAQGTLTPTGTEGTFVFTPADGFEGTATINYTIEDGAGGTDSAVHTIEVGNDPTPADGVVDGEEFDEVMGLGYDDSNAPTDGGGDVITDDADEIEGNGGDDTIDGAGGDDTISGGDDDDVITGGDGDDEIAGDDGNDELLGEDGDDTIEGGAGSDTIAGGEGDDIVDGGAGDDDIAVGGDDIAVGGSGDDVFTVDPTDPAVDVDVVIDGGTDGTDGNPDDDSNGNEGDVLDLSDQTDDLEVVFEPNPETGTVDGIDAFDGEDDITFEEIEKVVTGSGDDDIDGEDATGPIDVETGAGDDTIAGGDGDDTIDAGGDDDLIDGGDGDDEIDGGDGSDTIAGGEGDDTIDAGDGDDDITVGAGDVADGGDGDDVFTVDPTLGGDTPVSIDGGSDGTQPGDEAGPENGDDGDVLDLRGLDLVSLEFDPTDPESGTAVYNNDAGDPVTLTFTEIETVLVDETAPEAVDDGFTVSEDQDPADVVGNVLANDDDAETPNDLVVSDVDGSAPGTPVAGDNGGLITIEEDGSVSFDPNDAFDDLAPGETATTTVEYTVVDPSGLEDTATVTFTVTGVNDDPDAVDDSDTTAFETPVTIDLLANDTDVDNAPGDLVVSDATVDPAQGTLTPTGTEGTFVFTPADGFEGTATINYTIEDGAGGTDSAVHTIEVGNDPTPADGVVDGEEFDEVMGLGYDDSNAPTDGGGDVITDDADEIEGNGGDDTIDGAGGDDTISGGDDDDVITGGDGDDEIAGDDGNDELLGEDGDDTIEGGAGSDTIAGGEGDDIVDGGAGDDDIAVGGDDIAVGGSGDDVFTVDPTDPAVDVDVVIDGGTDGTDGNPDDDSNGNEGDVLDLSDQTDDLEVVFEPNPETGTVDGIDAFDGEDDITFEEIEKVVTGSGDDDIDGEDATGPIDVETGAGDDTIAGGDGDDTIDAGGDDDLIDGGDGDDEIDGGDGSDTIAGGEGDDTIDAGDGDDDITVGAGDVADGGDGDDVFTVDPTLGGDTPVSIDGGSDGTQPGDEAGPENGDDGDVLDLRGLDLVSLEFDPTDPESGTAVYNNDAGDPVTLTFTEIETVLVDETAPEAEDDGFVVSEDQDPADVVGNVLANDDDAETPNDLVVSDVDGSAPGTPVAGDNGGLITIEEDGSVSFDPNDAFDDLAPGETATTTVEYTVVDPSGLEDTATVTFTVTGVNDDPDAVDDSDTTAFETPVTIDLLANDTDVDNAPGDLVVTDATVDPAQGTLTPTGTEGAFVFTPADGFEGTATINYTIEDGAGGTDSAVHTVEVGNDPTPADGVVDGEEFGEVMNPGYNDADGPTDGGGDIIDGPDGLDDVIEGNGGDDTIHAGLGDDTVDGGTGNDEIDGNVGDDVLLGNEGEDEIDGGDGDDTIDGGDDDDLLVGGDGSDSVLGGEGNDVIDTSGPADLATGVGTPDSPYPGVFPGDPDTENDKDTVDGGAGDDTISTGDDADVITGGTGEDVIDGGIDNDTIDGGDDDDRIVGGEGADDILGGDGDDTIFAGNDPAAGLDQFNIEDDGTNPLGPDLNTENGKDTVSGGLGNDSIEGADDDDLLMGDEGNDTIDGGIDDDTIDGGADDDELRGGQGDDSILGGTGDDLIDGGIGDDSMFGGDDQDTFTNVNAGDTVDGGEGGDDFDTLNLLGSSPTGGSFDVVFDPTNSENGVVNYFDADGNAAGTLEFTNIENVIPCFTPGTLIATASGERLVQDLKVGDRVITRDNGIQEIAWVGQREMSGEDLRRAAHMRPVLIQKGALGKGLPERDMLVSPQHRVLMANDKTELYFDEAEVLVAAKHLTHMDGIDVVDVSQTTYIHVMFDQHEVILSDGAWTESFQPGDQTLASMGDAQRAEIFELFPELETEGGVEAYSSARRSLKKHEAKLLSQ